MRFSRVDPAGDARMPLTSSSYDPDGVRRSRLDEFARRAESASAVDSTLLYEFHSSHARGSGRVLSLHASRRRGNGQFQLGNCHA